LDWGDRQHAFALQDQSGYQASGEVKHSPETLHGWLQELGQKYASGWLALEGLPAQVMPVLVQYPWLTIYSVNPVTSQRFRQAFTPSGASADGPDAHALLNLVRTHTDKLRPWQAPDAQTQKLNKLVRARRNTVDRRTRLVLELTSLLKSYYPQALTLAGSLESPLALDFLRKWPELVSLKAARPATVKSFYYRHNVRSTELVEQRLNSIRQAVALTTDEACVSAAVLQVQQMADELAVYNKHLRQMDKAIQAAFKEHPQAHLFRDLPGAGKQMAPRLCAAFGTDSSRYPTAANLQKYAGVAPVREQSGRQEWVHWRWNAPKFLRQTFVEWAGLSIMWSAWAKKYYSHMSKKGKKHTVIVRALAFKWIRVLWKCWQTNTPYDEACYLKQLARRHSPYAC
jgi:transposase